ncbi:uncharacterized protein N7496_008928 [Penicillium cataractarum]|uniref:DUF7730 domain-containing protein n=1 Tax=Penicillium cataractarum TaxID=2100454 RepID=A0A9W9RZB7_9EURO|nr:uncharacterized protein N7496_008928 [Penicillium cataractarum]KAJ5369168.1 hypothetical protein N7496_008928 [Penicillium cataractarum]
MGRSESALPDIKERRALTPPLAPPPRITREYSRKEMTYLQQASPLFKPPQELRQEIYRYVLLTPGVYVICDLVTPCSNYYSIWLLSDAKKDKKTELFLDFLPTRDDPTILGLLLSCRRVYAEARDIFYGETKWHFPLDKGLFQLIERLPPARLNTIRDIALEARNVRGKGGDDDLSIWKEMVKAATSLKGLRTVTVYIPPSETKTNTQMVEVAREANFPALEIFRADVYLYCISL